MMTLTENQIRDIKRLVDYRGRKVHQREFKPGMSLNSYWESGCRDYFYYISVYGLQPRVVTTVPQNGTPFDGLNLKTELLEPNRVLVQKTIIRGKTVSITIFS